MRFEYEIIEVWIIYNSPRSKMEPKDDRGVKSKTLCTEILPNKRKNRIFFC